MKVLLYIIVFIILLLILLILIGKKSVQHEIIIDANVEKVWSVLIDTEKYSEWNPVMELVNGKVEVGNKVRYKFTQDDENISEIDSKVISIVPKKLLKQGGGVPLIITFDHKYILEPIDGKTKVTIHEEYTGAYVNFWNPEPVEKAYGRLNKALKARVESK